MSIRVLNEVLDHSAARGYDLCVLIALADAAHHDGVTWLPVVADPPTRSITGRAHCSKREALRAVAFLRDELLELQTVKVRRGRSFITVYRVVVGSIAEAPVDYDRLPFELPARFGEGVQPTPSTATRGESLDGQRDPETPAGQGANLAPSSGSVTVPAGPGSRCQEGDVHGASRRRFTVPASRARASEEGPAREAAAEPPVEPNATETGSPAAAEPPASDREISELVAGLPGADSDSPKRILPLAYTLPRSAFLDAIATVKRRRPDNPCGLLTHLLRIAAAERAAALSAQLAAAIPRKPYVPAPWTADELKREEPDRYVRLMARILDDQELEIALADHPGRLEELLELAGRVRAGAEAPAERETPEQARRRWVERHAPDDPAADVAHVIDGWDDVDPVERQDLLDLAERLRDRDAADRAAA